MASSFQSAMNICKVCLRWSIGDLRSTPLNNAPSSWSFQHHRSARPFHWFSNPVQKILWKFHSVRWRSTRMIHLTLCCRPIWSFLDNSSKVVSKAHRLSLMCRSWLGVVLIWPIVKWIARKMHERFSSTQSLKPHQNLETFWSSEKLKNLCQLKQVQLQQNPSQSLLALFLVN